MSSASSASCTHDLLVNLKLHCLSDIKCFLTQFIKVSKCIIFCSYYITISCQAGASENNLSRLMCDISWEVQCHFFTTKNNTLGSYLWFFTWIHFFRKLFLINNAISFFWFAGKSKVPFYIVSLCFNRLVLSVVKIDKRSPSYALVASGI